MSQSITSPQSYNHHNDNHYLIQHNKQLKCICNLCDCGIYSFNTGRHHCPRRPVKGDFQTTYSREYKKFQNIYPTAKPLNYRYQDRHYSPDVLKTNYQQNYQKKDIYLPPQTPLTKSRLQQLGQKILTTQVPFNGVTSYKEQYQPYKIKNIQNFNNPQTDILSPIKNSQYPSRPSVKFEGMSSYKSSYLAPPQPKKVQGRYEINHYKRPEVPFSGSSSYKDQFQPYRIEPHKQIYENLRYQDLPTVKFQGTTSYNQHYTPYELENSRISMKSNCKLDGIRIPIVNNINDSDHVYYDPQQNKFV